MKPISGYALCNREDFRTGDVAITYRVSSSTSGDEVLIRIEGDLDAEATAALRRECRSAGATVRLDLSGLKSVDAEGIRELRALSAKGAELRGASSYIRQLLLGQH